MQDEAAETVEETALTVQDGPGQSWGTSPLALLDEDTFRNRIKLASLEIERLTEVQKSVMKEGVDYGKIPGTQKPTLLKPGTETLNKLAGLVAMFAYERITGDGVTGPHILYVVNCYLRQGSADGPVIGHGMGSANSWETKHRYRNDQLKCPMCDQAAVFKSKPKRGEPANKPMGWYCWGKKGGCGAQFEPGDPKIAGQDVGRIDNPDPHELDNTLLKMSKKRAAVDATLTAHAASRIFTQDVEDNPTPPGDEPPPQGQQGKPSQKKPAPKKPTFKLNEKVPGRAHAGKTWQMMLDALVGSEEEKWLSMVITNSRMTADNKKKAQIVLDLRAKALANRSEPSEPSAPQDENELPNDPGEPPDDMEIGPDPPDYEEPPIPEENTHVDGWGPDQE